MAICVDTERYGEVRYGTAGTANAVHHSSLPTDTSSDQAMPRIWARYYMWITRQDSMSCHCHVSLIRLLYAQLDHPISLYTHSVTDSQICWYLCSRSISLPWSCSYLFCIVWPILLMYHGKGYGSWIISALCSYGGNDGLYLSQIWYISYIPWKQHLKNASKLLCCNPLFEVVTQNAKVNRVSLTPGIIPITGQAQSPENT